MSKLIVRIAKDGTVSVEVDGMRGEGCQDITRAFQQALGTTIDERVKPELYEQIDDIEGILYLAPDQEE